MARQLAIFMNIPISADEQTNMTTDWKKYEAVGQLQCWKFLNDFVFVFL